MTYRYAVTVEYGRQKWTRVIEINQLSPALAVNIALGQIAEDEDSSENDIFWQLGTGGLRDLHIEVEKTR